MYNSSNLWNSSGKKADPVWAQVTDYCQSHMHPPSKPNHGTITAALKASDEADLPPIFAAPAQAKFLALQAKAIRASRFLEVGALGGVTALWLLTLNPALRVTTVEVDPHHAATARKNFAAAGKDVEQRAELCEGAGLDVLPRLLEEVKAGKREPFDAVFIDADKQNNWAYFDMSVQMTRPGGIVIVDNVVRGGRIVDPRMKDDPGVKGATEVIEKAGADPRVESTVVQLCDEKGFDGMVLSVVN